MYHLNIDVGGGSGFIVFFLFKCLFSHNWIIYKWKSRQPSLCPSFPLLGSMYWNLVLSQSFFPCLTVIIIWCVILNICIVEIYLQGMKAYFYVFNGKVWINWENMHFNEVEQQSFKDQALLGFNYTTCTYPVYCNRSFKH